MLTFGFHMHCTQQICSCVEGSAGRKHGLSEQPCVIISCRHDLNPATKWENTSKVLV